MFRQPEIDQQSKFMSKTLLMIHGMWVGAWCWHNYRHFFEQHGWRVITPDLPYHGLSIRTPDHRLATASIQDYLEFLRKEINQLDEKPVVIGHSLGGLLAQMLAAEDLVEKAVLLTPAAPAGIFTIRPSVLRIFAPIMLMPNFWQEAIPTTYSLAKYAILNRIDDEKQSHDIFDKIGYESGRVLFEVGYWALDTQRTTHINAQDIQCPMLILSAADDHIMPASVVFDIWLKYQHCAQYRCLDNHAHWLIEETGWEKIAQDIQQWLEKN